MAVVVLQNTRSISSVRLLTTWTCTLRSSGCTTSTLRSCPPSSTLCQNTLRETMFAFSLFLLQTKESSCWLIFLTFQLDLVWCCIPNTHSKHFSLGFDTRNMEDRIITLARRVISEQFFPKAFALFHSLDNQNSIGSRRNDLLIQKHKTFLHLIISILQTITCKI